MNVKSYFNLLFVSSFTSLFHVCSWSIFCLFWHADYTIASCCPSSQLYKISYLFLFSLPLYMFADSTVLAYVLSELNRRHNYGLDLFLLSVDDGITGYRDDSLETVKRNEIQVSVSFFSFFLE